MSSSSTPAPAVQGALWKTGCKVCEIQRTGNPVEIGSLRNSRELTAIASHYDWPKEELNSKNISIYGNAGEGNLKGPGHK